MPIKEGMKALVILLIFNAYAVTEFDDSGAHSDVLGSIDSDAYEQIKAKCEQNSMGKTSANNPEILDDNLYHKNVVPCIAEELNKKGFDVKGALGRGVTVCPNGENCEEHKFAGDLLTQDEDIPLKSKEFDKLS